MVPKYDLSKTREYVDKLSPEEKEARRKKMQVLLAEAQKTLEELRRRGITVVV